MKSVNGSIIFLRETARHQFGRMFTCLLCSLILVSGLGCQQEIERDEDEGPLVVVTYGGGAYQASHIEAFIRPFEESFEVDLESVVWGAEYGKLLDMVRSGRVPWDVIEVTGAQFARGIRDRVFEPLSVSIDEAIFRPIPASPAVHPLGVPNVYWSTVLAYRRSDFPSAEPRNWSDFWDVNRFPGPRALYDDPRGNLEFALLADGVAMRDLYPLDVDRAFSKLDEIKPHVRVWWQDGTEPVRLLLTNQVTLTSAWSGRIFASAQAREEINYKWEGAAHELDYWVIPRGSRKVNLASEFIRFASRPERMAHQAELTAYGPANLLAVTKVKKEVLLHLPTENSNWNRSFVINSNWWAEHESVVIARWISWKNR
ncbi:ABC transporter substrate-binding protein [Acidobacteria bacterium AH-259-A15]|nr:ABC transporter substrate-binding protein [Acidobacteria bacterium AH-259-A15]